MAPLQHPAPGRGSHLTPGDRKEVTQCNRKPGPPRHSPRRSSPRPRNRDCTAKEKIKEKLIAIRDERASIRRDIQRLDAELETGRQVFMLALDLLDKPQELYRQAGPVLRKVMNETIFTKLKLNGVTVAADELAEPFDVIVPAGRIYERRSYQRKRPPVASGVVFHEGVSADDLTSTDLLELALGGTGSSKLVMVGDTGIEPVTSSV